MARGRRIGPPASGKKPSVISGRPSRARSLIAPIRRSQISAISKPPPSAWPLIAAISGFLASSSSNRARGEASKCPAGPAEAAGPSPWLRSAPAQKARPAPVITALRISSLLRTSSSASISWDPSAASIALSLSGRLSVIVATRSLTSKRTSSAIRPPFAARPGCRSQDSPRLTVGPPVESTRLREVDANAPGQPAAQSTA